MIGQTGTVLRAMDGELTNYFPYVPPLLARCLRSWIFVCVLVLVLVVEVDIMVNVVGVVSGGGSGEC